MERSKYVAMMDGDYQTIREINSTKGVEYAGNDDALSNFKITGAAIGLSPEQVWSVLASKHWAAVMAYVKEGEVKSNEPIEGRLHDVILYCFLLLGLIREKKPPDPQDDLGELADHFSPARP
jgi:hypothetical protein